MSFGRIVAATLTAVGAPNVEMSPRTLRNTYCRRKVLAGRTRDDVSQMLGLTSNRTCARIAATIGKG